MAAIVDPMRTDLLDDFDDRRVIIVVAEGISQLRADIVVMSAGVPISAHAIDRREMDAANIPIFQQMADDFARYAPTRSTSSSVIL
jgi:malate/lactate dehydrogenase